MMSRVETTRGASETPAVRVIRREEVRDDDIPEQQGRA
jgi:hypothetical protein